jgi:tetratricopeptide (TPR) repeat protein
MRKRFRSLGPVASATALGLLLAVGPALAEGNPSPPPPSQQPSSSGAPKAGTKSKAPKKAKKRSRKQQRSDREFLKGYAVGFNLIQAGRYEEAITAFRALGHDDHPDVANYIGYASRKLGRYADAQVWYERALAADPKHVRTWQYYGMWHVEQGNMLKAADFLAKIRAICNGTDCKEYADLKGAMEGTVVY